MTGNDVISNFCKGQMSILISCTEGISKYPIILAADPIIDFPNICLLKLPVLIRRRGQIWDMSVYEMLHNSRSLRSCKGCDNICFIENYLWSNFVKFERHVNFASISLSFEDKTKRRI